MGWTTGSDGRTLAWAGHLRLRGLTMTGVRTDRTPDSWRIVLMSQAWKLVASSPPLSGPNPGGPACLATWAGHPASAQLARSASRPSRKSSTHR